jgi:hypothetical protein
MKKSVILICIVLVASLAVEAGSIIGLSVSGNYLVPSDQDYKDIYGNGMVYPELKMEFNLFKGLSVWLGYGFLTADGVLPVVEYDADSSQHHLSLGAGYTLKFLKYLGFRVQLGSFNVYYIEKASDLKETGMAFGYRADLSLMFFAGKKFFVGLTGGYLNANKSIHDRTVKFGGLKGGLEIGLYL